MAHNKHLERQIGLWSLVAYYFSTIVGVGIFLSPLTAARIAGPASLISWIVVIIMIYPFALIFGNISQEYKVSGSIQKFLEESLGFENGKASALFLVITAMFGNSILGLYASQYLMAIFSIEDKVVGVFFSILMMSISSLFNLMNINFSSKIQAIALAILVIVIEIVAILSVPTYQISNITPFIPNGTYSIFAAIIPCFYAVVGWENVDAMAEEVKDPVKTYKKAIRITLLLIAVFYISLVSTVIFVLNPEQIKSSNTVMTILLSNLFGQQAGHIGSLFALMLLFLGINVWILGTSRLIFALARDKILPNSLSIINKRTGIPTYAVLIQLVIYSLIFITMYLTEIHEDKIVEVAGINYILLYVIIFSAARIKFANNPKLKNLSLFSLLISESLLIINFNYNVALSIAIALICLGYVKVNKKKHHSNI